MREINTRLKRRKALRAPLSSLSQEEPSILAFPHLHVSYRPRYYQKEKEEDEAPPRKQHWERERWMKSPG
ncbi:hypothetical protein AOLI_G00114090 [Acnodon oligacanthus]